jgi:hypothetical protein
MHPLSGRVTDLWSFVLVFYFAISPYTQSLRAQEQLCGAEEFPDPVRDIRVYDERPPSGQTRVHDENDLDIKFRVLADDDQCSEDKHIITHAIQNLQTGPSSGLIFRWDEAKLSRPSPNPLRSTRSIINRSSVEIAPEPLETRIKFSPSLLRETSATALLVGGVYYPPPEHSTWSTLVTDFVNATGDVVNLFFRIKATVTIGKKPI